MSKDPEQMIDWLSDYGTHGKWFRIAQDGGRVTTDCLALPTTDRITGGLRYMGCMMFCAGVQCDECPVGKLAEKAGIEPPEPIAAILRREGKTP